MVLSISLSALIVGGQRVFAAHLRCNAGGSDRRTQSMYDAVRLSAVSNASPPSITLQWEAHNSNSTYNYKIYRKNRDDLTWGNAIGNTNNLQFTDSNVAAGSSYEYRVERDTSGCAHQFGYIYSGVNRDIVDQRGKIILLVDNRFTTSLATDLEQLERDLIGDGWQVLRHDVSKDASVSSIKQIIMSDYNADQANVKAVYLFGHVPVPYSGMHNMDGHEQRAFPADVYYGDVNGNWSDSSVNNSGATNPNVPGDGRFDQKSISAVQNGSDLAPELFVGRVDFWDMPTFSQSEEALLANYISKAHDYRNKVTTVRQRGWISDRLGQYHHWETPGIGMWHSMVPLVGRNTYADDTTLSSQTSGIYRSQYHPNPTVELNNGDSVYGNNGSSSAPNYDEHGFIFADANSTASYSHMDESGATSDYRVQDPPVIFNIMFGSYFGDWDTQNNLLRAPLAQSTYGLSNVWGVWGGWQFHHMAMGEPIGYSVVATHNGSVAGSGNNGSQYLYNQYYNITSPEMNLMGDPTLRMHIVAPVTNVAINGSQLSWNASPDQNIVGYHVYRASSIDAAFTRLTSNPTSALSFDIAGGPANSVYMVRAVKHEVSPSGSYYNLSQGAFLGDDSPVNPEPTGDGVDIPSRLQAEDYTGYAGQSWTETTSDSGGGLNIAGLDDGEFATFLIDVPTTTEYQLDVRFATPNNDGSLRVLVDNTVVANINLPSTGGWQNWQTASATINLSAGNGQEVKVEFIRSSGGSVINMNWLEFSSLGTIPTGVAVATSEADVAANVIPIPVVAVILAASAASIYSKRIVEN